jgi:hypothetical protein
VTLLLFWARRVSPLNKRTDFLLHEYANKPYFYSVLGSLTEILKINRYRSRSPLF